MHAQVESLADPVACVPADPERLALLDRKVPPQTSWTSGRMLLVALLVSAAVRAMSTSAVPLIISNDGVDYIHWAEQIYKGEALSISSYRTPGYPLFLAGAFHLFGVGQAAILVAQHVLAFAGTALVFLIAARLTRPLLAAVAAVLYSLDPWLGALEVFVLSETLTWFLMLAAVGLVYYRPRGNLFWMILLGAVLGFACLTRPSCQVLIPFLLLARIVVTFTTWKRGLLALAAGLVGLAVVIGPWLDYNRHRGIDGLASGSGALLWLNVKTLDLLVVPPNFPLDDDIQAAYTACGLDRPGWSEEQMFVFLFGIDAFHHRSDLLGRWARDSIRANPRAYIKSALYAVCWQLKLYPKAATRDYDDLQFYLTRAGIGGDNSQFSGQPENMKRFLAHSDGGWFRQLLRACDKFTVPGLPAIPLFVAVGAGLLIRLVSRDWATVLVLLATLAFMLAHALLLSPMSRYTLVVWPIWYAAGMIVIESMWRMTDRARAARKPAMPETSSPY